MMACCPADAALMLTCSFPVLLVDISCQPDRSHCMSLLDVHSLATSRRGQQQPDDEGGRAVQLLPGQTYSVSVVLSLDPHAIRSLR